LATLMTIESQTESLLVLRQSPHFNAVYDKWVYWAAIILALLFGVIGILDGLNGQGIIDKMIPGCVLCLTIAGVGLCLDWTHAEVVCRLDKSNQLLTIERITPRFHRSFQYPLDELQKAEVYISDNPNRSTTYAIRFQMSGNRVVSLRKSRRQHEQDVAVAAIRQFIKPNVPAVAGDEKTQSAPR
jgi:hypothetical protein